MNRRDFIAMISGALLAPKVPTAPGKLMMGFDPAYAVGGDKSIITLYVMMRNGCAYPMDYDKRSYQLPITGKLGEEIFHFRNGFVKMADVVSVSTTKP